jgi:glutathionyl-hydroquinone reductase
LYQLYQWTGVAATVNIGHINERYYGSHHTINPNGILPARPILDLDRRTHVAGFNTYTY